LQQLRDIKQTRKTELETRQAQLFMQIYDRFQSSEFQRNDYLFTRWEWEDFEDFSIKHGNADSYSIHSSIGSYYEGIGLLVKRGLIDDRDCGRLDVWLHPSILGEDQACE